MPKPFLDLPADRRSEQQVIDDLNAMLEGDGGVDIGVMHGLMLSAFLWAAVLLLVLA